MNWKIATKKKIDEEFRRLLYSIGTGNGLDDLVDVAEGLSTQKAKQEFVISWHEQDEE